MAGRSVPDHYTIQYRVDAEKYQTAAGTSRERDFDGYIIFGAAGLPYLSRNLSRLHLLRSPFQCGQDTEPFAVPEAVGAAEALASAGRRAN